MTDDDKQELVDMYGDMVQALHDDLDQGIACLTDKAVKDFHEKHPEFSMAMSRLGEKIGDLS